MLSVLFQVHLKDLSFPGLVLLEVDQSPADSNELQLQLQL